MLTATHEIDVEAVVVRDADGSSRHSGKYPCRHARRGNGPLQTSEYQRRGHDRVFADLDKFLLVITLPFAFHGSRRKRPREDGHQQQRRSGHFDQRRRILLPLFYFGTWEGYGWLEREES